MNTPWPATVVIATVATPINKQWDRQHFHFAVKNELFILGGFCFSAAMDNKTKKSGDVVDDDASSPASSFSVFVIMEDLIDKLKLLDYESQFAREFNTKLLSK